MSESRILQAFVAVLSAVCFVTVAQLQPAEPGAWLNLVLLGLLTALASAWSVRIRALGLELTPTDPFVLFALVSIGTHAAAMLAVVAVAGAAVWRGQRQRLIQYVFNFAALPLAAVLAGRVFDWTGGRHGLALDAILLPLAGATLVYLLVNTGLTAVAIALSRGAGFLEAWARGLWWTAWPTLTALSLTLCMVLLVQAMGTWGLALALPPVFALAATQRVSKIRLDTARAAADSAEDLAGEAVPGV